MHHSSIHRQLWKRGFAVALVVWLPGCVHVPHNDVLVFGTDTTLGVNVAADPANTQIPTFTVGYKRREAVWMPLVVNGQSSVPVCGADTKVEGGTCQDQDSSLKDAKYFGTSKREHAKETDTYSVFASFGGKGTAGSSEAGVQIAQFFATGIAAQRLASNPMAPQLVSVQSEAAAKAAGDSAEAQAALALANFSGLSPEQVDKASERGISWANSTDEKVIELATTIDAAAVGEARDALVAKLVNGVNLSEDVVTGLKTQTGTELKAVLDYIAGDSVVAIDLIYFNHKKPAEE